MTEKIKQMGAQVWEIVFRVVVVVILPWSVWVTNMVFEGISFRNRGDRFSASDGANLEKTILEESIKVQNKLHGLEREFSQEFVRHSEMEALLKQWSDRQK